MADAQSLPAVAAASGIPHPPPSRAATPSANLHAPSCGSPFRSGKRRINEAEVAYATSLELPLASGKRTYFGGGHSGYTMSGATLNGGGGASTPTRSGSAASSRGAAGVSSYGMSGGVVSVVFGGTAGSGGLDGDSSPALARRFNEALYADNKLKSIQARVAASAAIKASKGDGAEDEDLDDEGNPKPKKKRGNSSTMGDYSPRKRIEDFMFLKKGSQWCPPTSYNGGIPEYKSPRKNKIVNEDGTPRKLTNAELESLKTRMSAALRRENKKKAKGPQPTPRKKEDGTFMTPAEQAAYERTLVPNLTNRLYVQYIETSKKNHEILVMKREKEEAGKIKDAKLKAMMRTELEPTKKLDSEDALNHNIQKLYQEPMDRKKKEALARETKEKAAKEKLVHLTRQQQMASGRRLHDEGIEKQRNAVAKAAQRYLMRPATASPTAAYMQSHEVESKFCPGLPPPSSSSPRDRSPTDRPATAAAGGATHIPKPPANPRAE